MAAVYKCLGCGTTQGTPAEQGSENWFWRVMDHGKVGPFHDSSCAANFRMTADDEAKFTLSEYSHLNFLRWRNEQEMNAISSHSD